MDKLQAMQLFARVVDSGSFTAGAGQMGISRALASKLIQNLEDQLGVRLLNRTTRRVSLTDPGKNYYARVSQLLDALAEAEAEAAELQVEPRGRLRVSVPISFAVKHLAPALADFQRTFPRVELELGLNDRLVDLVDEGFDMAVRIGRLADSSLVARRIAPATLLTVASPNYLELHGTPTHPDELSGHNVLVYTLTAKPEEWVFKRGSETVTTRIKGNLFTNNGDYLAAAAIEGAGVTLLPAFIVFEAVTDGRLVEVLGDWPTPPLGIYAIYPQTRALPAKTRVLMDFLVDRFGPLPYWEKACADARTARAIKRKA